MGCLVVQIFLRDRQKTELAADKPVLLEVEHLSGKISDKELDSLRAVLNRNAEVFSRHETDIGCCNFVENEIEIEEGSVPHREGARRITPHKSEACRKEIEMLMEHDYMIEPSKSPWACVVVMAKKKGGNLGLNAVTIKDSYPIPRIDESLSKLGDAKSSRRWIWALRSGRCPSENRIERRQALRANWDCTNGKECRLGYTMRRLRSND